MIKTRKDLTFYIKEDAARNGLGGGKLLKIRYWAHLLLNNENARAFRYIKTMRYYEYYLNVNSSIVRKLLRIWYKIKLSYLGGKYGIFITPNAAGYGLRIAHLSGGGGVHLNVKRIGNYCGFNSGVLIGNKDSQDNRCVIGDNTAFGPGSKAFGKLTIGNNVFVAPNAVVTKDVPDNAIVGGVPAIIIKMKEE